MGFDPDRFLAARRAQIAAAAALAPIAHPDHERPAGAQAEASGDDVDEPPDVAIPTLERARRKLRVLDGGRVRARTITQGYTGRLTRADRAAGLALVEDRSDRPKTRGDCEDAPRPCPYVSCSHNLYLDVNPESGAIKLNFPHLEVWELAETCSLDVADRGGITLEETGVILNVTRERARQIQAEALRRIKDQTGIDLGLPPERP